MEKKVVLFSTRTDLQVPQKSIVFVSTLTDEPWGGSEELWSRAALHLVSDRIPVSASVAEWSPLPPRIRDLGANGGELWVRPGFHSWQREFPRWLAASVKRVITAAACVSRGQFGVGNVVTWRQGR